MNLQLISEATNLGLAAGSWHCITGITGIACITGITGITGIAGITGFEEMFGWECQEILH